MSVNEERLWTKASVADTLTPRQQRTLFAIDEGERYGHLARRPGIFSDGPVNYLVGRGLLLLVKGKAYTTHAGRAVATSLRILWRGADD